MAPVTARRLALLGGCLALAVIVLACGEKPAPRVSADVQRRLPTQVAQLASLVCPDPSLPRPQAARDRRSGAVGLRALERAYRDDPDALVRATFVLSEGGVEHKDITVEELVRSHVLGFESRLNDPALSDGYDRCLRSGRNRLRALQG